MEAREILEQMIELKSVYGVGARMFINDPDLGKKFIFECYDTIKEDRKSMENHFTDKLVEQIISFVNERKK